MSLLSKFLSWWAVLLVLLGLGGCSAIKAAFNTGPDLGKATVDGAVATVGQLLNQYQADETLANVHLSANDPRYTATVVAGPVWYSQVSLSGEGLEALLAMQSSGHGVESINTEQAARIHEILTARGKDVAWKWERILELLKEVLPSPSPSGDGEQQSDSSDEPTAMKEPDDGAPDEASAAGMVRGSPDQSAAVRLSSAIPSRFALPRGAEDAGDRLYGDVRRE